MENKKAKKQRGAVAETWHRFCKNKLAVVGLIILIIFFLAAVFAEFIAPYDYAAQDLNAIGLSPSAEHIMGTDNVGRDILSSLQAHHMTFLIHTRSDLRYAYIRDIVHNFPSLKIEVAHMARARPGDVSFMIEMLEALAPFPHVSFDTSTVRQSQVVEAAVKIVGPERILYGSDFPFFMDELGIEDIMEQQIRHILKAGLPSAQQDLIFSENFKRLITRGI